MCGTVEQPGVVPATLITLTVPKLYPLCHGCHR